MNYQNIILMLLFASAVVEAVFIAMVISDLKKLNDEVEKNKEEGLKTWKMVDETINALGLKRCDYCNKLFSQDKLKETNDRAYLSRYYSRGLRNKRICKDCEFNCSIKKEDKP